MNPNNPVSKKPKISIITVCYNSELTIADTILSINSQDYPNIEHVIIDGLSRDNTLEIIDQYKTNKQIIYSEKDSGIYDAMNKGINRSTGDIVGFLNADDKLSDSTVISTIAENFINTNTDAVYGDLIYFKNPDQTDQSDKIIRYFKSRTFKTGLFARGWRPQPVTI